MATEEDARELPDEQSKIEDDDRKDDPDIQTMERAEELADQYETIKDRTVDENTVLGHVKEIDTARSNNNIVVTVDLPAEESDKQFRFKKPKVWSDDYDFVRWIKYYDYDADSFPLMLEDDCEVEVSKDTDGYDLVIPENDSHSIDASNATEKLHQAYKHISVVYIENGVPISSIIMLSLIIHSISASTGLISYGMSNIQLAGLTLIGFIVCIAALLAENHYLENHDLNNA